MAGSSYGLRRWRGLEGLQDNVLGILERAAAEAHIDERLDFGFGDMDGHGTTPSRSMLADLVEISG